MNARRTALVDSQRPDESIISEAAELLRKGKVVVYPTDTIYALGVNALAHEAIERLFAIKERELNKPVHVVVDSLEMAEKYVVLNDAARQLAARFLPGPLTLILPKREVVPDILVGGQQTLGIRIPDNNVCLMLARSAGIPFTTTGANIAGGANPYTIDEAVNQLGPHIDQVDLLIDQGPLAKRPPSTLIDLTGSTPKILRDGPISADEILRTIE